MNLLLLLMWFAVCADQDARRRKVSNALTLGGGLLALLYLLLAGTSWLGAPPQTVAWTVVLALVLTLPGYALGKLGAGDVKLLVTLGLASNPPYLLGTLIGAGIASVLWLLVRQKIGCHTHQGLRNRYPNLAPGTSNKQPFVPFLFIGFCGAALCFH